MKLIPMKKLIVFISIVFSIVYSEIVYRVPIEGVIDLGLPPYIKRVIKEAEASKIDAIVFEINTFGGRVDAATQIKDAILSSEVQTIAFINRRAISAGALISLSCEKIFMTGGGLIGAATAVDMSGKKGSEKVIKFLKENEFQHIHDIKEQRVMGGIQRTWPLKTALLELNGQDRLDMLTLLIERGGMFVSDIPGKNNTNEAKERSKIIIKGREKITTESAK